jgi:hypothetical protein
MALRSLGLGAGDLGAGRPHVVTHALYNRWPLVRPVPSRIWKSMTLSAVAREDPFALRLGGRRLRRRRRRQQRRAAALHHPVPHPAPPGARWPGTRPLSPPRTPRTARHWSAGHDQPRRQRHLHRAGALRHAGGRAGGNNGGYGGRRGEAQTSGDRCHDRPLGGRRNPEGPIFRRLGAIVAFGECRPIPPVETRSVNFSSAR